MIKLVFDRNLKGLAKWLCTVRRLYGLAEILVPDDGLAVDDYGLIEYAVRRGAFVVTADKRMYRGRPEFGDHVIVIVPFDENGRKRNYEELAT